MIQLTIAPVSMQMAIGTFLIELTSLLGRLVDRFRVLNEKCDSPQTQADNPFYVNSKQEL